MTKTTTHHIKPTSLLPNGLKDDAKLHHSSRPSSSRTSTVRPSNHSSSSAKTKLPKEGTVRYVMTKYGLEVRRYSTDKWLNIDLLAKDACTTQERAYAEIMEKKQQYERMSKRIYASEYYEKRLRELLLFRKSGIMSHEEWAKQSYQLLCVKTLLDRSLKQERKDILVDEKARNARLSQRAYQQWIESKTKEGMINNTLYNKRDFLHENKKYVWRNRQFETPAKFRRDVQSFRLERPNTPNTAILLNANDSLSSDTCDASLIKSEI
ncbi:unnamed protein product, partial [Didymodactylos carnosus]